MPTSPADALGKRSDLRLRPARPGRAIVGVAIFLGALLAVVALLGDAANRRDVLVLNRVVEPGERITDDMLDVVAVGTDDPIAITPASRRSNVIGQYARYRLAPGLFGTDGFQSRPIVTPGRLLVSIPVEAGLLPPNLETESPLALVVSPAHRGDTCTGPLTIAATLVVPPTVSTGPAADSGTVGDVVGLTVEIDPVWAIDMAGASVSGIALAGLDRSISFTPFPPTPTPCPIASAAPGEPAAQPPVTTDPPSHSPLRPTTTVMSGPPTSVPPG